MSSSNDLGLGDSSASQNNNEAVAFNVVEFARVSAAAEAGACASISDSSQGVVNIDGTVEAPSEPVGVLSPKTRSVQSVLTKPPSGPLEI